MKSLSVQPSAVLVWRKSGSTPPDYELVGTAGVYATLSFQNEEKTLARIRTAEGAWTLKHLGLLAPVVTLREEGGTVNLATFRPHALRHGRLEFQDGAAFEWAWPHDAGPGGAFLDVEGKPLIHLKAVVGRDLDSPSDLETCEVVLNMTQAAHYRQALLTAVGWYLVLFDHMKALDNAAAETALRL